MSEEMIVLTEGKNRERPSAAIVQLEDVRDLYEVRTVLDAVQVELLHALGRFPKFNGPHEGWAVIREEMDELWEHVKANTGSSSEAQAEAIQIAAMALRYARDVCGAH